jgi:flagellar basal body-associated protein FliL
MNKTKIVYIILGVLLLIIIGGIIISEFLTKKNNNANNSENMNVPDFAKDLGTTDNNNNNNNNNNNKSLVPSDLFSGYNLFKNSTYTVS